MPRALRIAYPGAVYHIRSRGNDRGDVFGDDDDRRYYLDLLCSVISAFRLKIYAYALMSNHIHLFLKTLLPNISEAMHRLNLDYSIYFNKRHGKTGHLFESRFKSKLVQEDRYFLALLRYIHMNPVKAGIVSAPEEYDWSSHRAYLGDTDRVVSNPKEALLFFSDNLERARAAYLDFLGQPIPEKEWNILNKERNGILGDALFRHSLKKAAGVF
ncbi:MAG: transposase [Elusimicrobia bacterium]|nr:transposase [Elusimicrobiota bacterium]